MKFLAKSKQRILEVLKVRTIETLLYEVLLYNIQYEIIFTPPKLYFLTVFIKLFLVFYEIIF